MIPWTKKYEPKNSSEIVGHPEAIYKIKQAINMKPVMLYGPTGSGKTALAYALGKENNLEIFEINTSDIRNKKTMEEILGSSMHQQSLFFKGKLILIDDIDAMSGTKDRGGLPAIIKIMQESKHSIIFTCTDPWNSKLSLLRKKTILVELTSLKKTAILERLKQICEKENIFYKDEDLDLVVKDAQGDMRAAINDLQLHCTNGSLNIQDKEQRTKKQDINYCLRKILKSKKWEEVHNIFWEIDMDLNECLLWLDENLPNEYDSEALKKAYERISRADVFNGRIRRWQHWGFLIYINTLLTAGVAFSKKEANPKFQEYKRSTRILKLWMAKQRNAKKHSICEKIADKTHTSKKEAFKSTFPYLKNLLLEEEFIKELELDEEEIEWLKK